jgi:hypothetical protein
MLVLEESTLGLGGQFQVILVWNGMESLDCLRSRVWEKMEGGSKTDETQSVDVNPFSQETLGLSLT